MAYNFGTVKILIVEDSQPMTQITNSLLSSFGVNHIDIATNTDSAYKLFCKEKHDLILTDWLIKPLNGIQLTQKIRSDSASPDPFVPIILMTGFSEKKRVESARDTGVTEFMTKPFTANDLYRRLDHIIMKPRQFVKAPEFFGPDRRRRFLDEERTPKRRSEDNKKK